MLADPQSRSPERPSRGPFYPEMLNLSVKLRWALILAGAIWIWLERPGGRVVLLLAAAAAYAAVLAVLRQIERHPALMATGLADAFLIIGLLILDPAADTLTPLLFVFPVAVLTIAYGWSGAALSLGGYLVGEGVLLIPDVGAGLEIAPLLARAATLTFVGSLLGFLVSRHAKARLRLAGVMIHDRVTGLYNRQYFTQALEQLHKLALRGGWPYSVVVIEVRGPTPGSAGRGPWSDADQTLRPLAARVRTLLRSTDLIARTAEREFVIALPETGLPDAEVVARKLMEGLGETVPGVELSVGIADLRPTRASGFKDALQAAYAALAEARPSGRSELVTVHTDEWKEEQEKA